MNQENPILNNPYEEPKYHYATDQEGNLDYSRKVKGRRIFTPDIQVIPSRQEAQRTAFEVNDFSASFESHIINMLRKEVGTWRNEKYPQVTRLSKELLNYWFDNPERFVTKKLFFAQQEAIETAIWLNEIAERSNFGQNVLTKIKDSRHFNGNSELKLPRFAFKMATGAGKTVVMAAFILYHFLNRQEYRGDIRFADYFLVVSPGITIKDRLGVLYVDTINKDIQKVQDYYHQRGLVPAKYEQILLNLNSRIVITNYHTFEQRTLQGNKRSPFDGKLDANGEKNIAKEDYNQVIRRAMGKLKRDARLLILNDEAHHCYLPKAKGQAIEGEDTRQENARASIWHTGLSEVTRRFKVNAVYDLTATPYYLTGSGYEPYSMFPWVVSDFGLIEAIESGLVKIPFLPETDNTQELSMPVLRNLYEHVKTELPRKGQRKLKSEAKSEGKAMAEEPPKLPKQVKLALDQFYNHYKDEFEHRNKGQRAIEDTPPVFIIVCNNTSVSREVYKYIAGYELDSADDKPTVVTGQYSLFSNYDMATRQPLRKPPTLLIDSSELEETNQINDDFKRIFAPEIERFKQEYRIAHPDKSPENLTDADILREVVNTVGKPKMLGEHIRCVVSVSMLTEGWDANTVTHIMGLRAFGSQLLCEQVAGRALRRKQYYLDKSGKFPPEYAHIIGVPFKFFKGGKTEITEQGEYNKIFAMPERQKQHEIIFPNIIGYRREDIEGEITADFSRVENFEIDGSRYAFTTEMANAFSEDRELLEVRSVFGRRDQELVYLITKELIAHKFSDLDGKPYFQKFNKLKKIVEEWYRTKVVAIGITEEEYRKYLIFEEPKVICEYIGRGIHSQDKAREKILPVFNFYNKFGSTKYVNGITSRHVYATKHSHVNYVVADTESWEQIAAKTLEELAEKGYVKSYVKNAFLGFSIPYISQGKDKNYFPDFLVRCKNGRGNVSNLIIEITGMNQDKQDKKWYVENCWLPAVNNVRERYGYDEWQFIEIANDIRDIKNQLVAKITQKE